MYKTLPARPRTHTHTCAQGGGWRAGNLIVKFEAWYREVTRMAASVVDERLRQRAVLDIAGLDGLPAGKRAGQTESRGPGRGPAGVTVCFRVEERLTRKSRRRYRRAVRRSAGRLGENRRMCGRGPAGTQPARGLGTSLDTGGPGARRALVTMTLPEFNRGCPADLLTNLTVLDPKVQGTATPRGRRR